ncbi:hypothetical protein CIB48_g7880 [Xylaria polymorpha]|nr:hypothetical protein CIB48_g7880 [Xylaria polymorpha]
MQAPPAFDAADVAQHNTEQDCWVVINGDIWDVTEWITQHPGGKQAIFQFAGQDASAAYNGQHPKELVFQQLQWKYAKKGRLITKADDDTMPPMQEDLDDPDIYVKQPDVIPEYTLRMSHGWTITDGTWDPIPQDQEGVNETFPTRATSTIPSARGVLSRASRSLATLLSYRPPWTSRSTTYGSACRERSADICTLPPRLAQPCGVPMKPQEKPYLTKRPWVIMPIWVEDEWGSDWVVIVWFSQAIEPVDYFDRIISYGIFDSRRSPDPDDNGRHPPIQERQEAIRHGLHELWRIGGFNADEATIMEVFSSPMPLDEATSGERSFAIVKGLISQNWYTSGLLFSRVSTIKSMPQWVNPYQQRVELAGINAWTLMASLDYNARITVETVLPNVRTEVAADGEKRFIYNYDLAGPFHEPPIASYDYLLPSGQDYTPPPGLTKPNNFWHYAYEDQTP